MKGEMTVRIDDKSEKHEGFFWSDTAARTK